MFPDDFMLLYSNVPDRDTQLLIQDVLKVSALLNTYQTLEEINVFSPSNAPDVRPLVLTCLSARQTRSDVSNRDVSRAVQGMAKTLVNLKALLMLSGTGHNDQQDLHAGNHGEIFERFKTVSEQAKIDVVVGGMLIYTMNWASTPLEALADYFRRTTTNTSEEAPITMTLMENPNDFAILYLLAIINRITKSFRPDVTAQELKLVHLLYLSNVAYFPRAAAPSMVSVTVPHDMLAGDVSWANNIVKRLLVSETFMIRL